MQDIQIERNGINVEALDAAVRAEFGEQVSGISSGPYGVIVHLSDDVTPQQVNQARQIVQNHDPSVQTPEQQAAEQRRQQLAQARSENSADLDVSKFSGEKALIQQMAQKIAWLEAEIREMRG